jgi:hypothetical protein
MRAAYNDPLILRKNEANQWRQVEIKNAGAKTVTAPQDFTNRLLKAAQGLEAELIKARGPAPSFSTESWNILLDQTVEKIKSLSVSKGAEYAHGDDRLDNFRRNGADLGLPMETIWRAYTGKHWDSITTYVKDLTAGRTRQRSEPMSGRADDMIVYLILFKAMLQERGEP